MDCAKQRRRPKKVFKIMTTYSRQCSLHVKFASAQLQEDESRRLFLFNILDLLLMETELAENENLSSALISVAASPTLKSQNPTGDLQNLHRILKFKMA